MEGNWFGVRTIYEHEGRAHGGERLYEERIILIRASSAKESLIKAEQEASDYASTLEGVRFLGLATSFELFDLPGDKAEVFSLMRESRFEPKPYLDRFFETGQERTR